MEVKAPLKSIAEQQAAAACKDRAPEEAGCETGVVIAERLCVSVDLGDGEPCCSVSRKVRLEVLETTWQCCNVQEGVRPLDGCFGRSYV